MARSKTLATVKAEFLDSSPEAQALWDRTSRRRALSAMLVQARSRGGLSQAELAVITGWDKGYISRLESATEGFPSVDTLARYLSACGEHLGIVTYRQEADRQQVMGFTTISGEERLEKERVVASAPAAALFSAGS